MSKLVYFTNNLKIEVLPNNTVRLTNMRENGKIYLLVNIPRIHYLLRNGGKQWRISTGDGGYEKISFNVQRKHISNAGGGINTYIAPHDYDLLMNDLLLSYIPIPLISLSPSERQELVLED